MKAAPAWLLFILFLGLKLGHIINWSWVWITAPLWGGLALMFVFLLIVGLLAIAGKLAE